MHPRSGILATPAGFIQVPVQHVDLPFAAVRVLHPELVLVGVTAVAVHLFPGFQSGCPDPQQVPQDRLVVPDLDAEMVRSVARGLPIRVQGQVQGGDGRQELDVTGMGLHGILAEQFLVECDASFQIAYGKRQVDLGIT